MTAPDDLSFVYAADLLEREMPEIRYLCKPWVPEGVTILAGRPKIGKTTLLRCIALAIANGTTLWGAATERAHVFFLSLEEGDKLMRRKLLKAGVTPAQVEKIAFGFSWPQGAAGCAQLDDLLETYPDVRLIVVDSLTRFRDGATRERTQFQQDDDAVAMLSEIAKRRAGLSIIVLHHTTKVVNSSDPIADISGTYGLSAAADNFMVLRKEGSDFVLHCGGRYWDEDDDAFVLQRESGAWTMAGRHDGITLSPMQSDYLQRLAVEGTVTTRGMATRFRVKDNTATEILQELQQKSLVERTADGWTATAAGIAKASSLSTKQPKREKEEK